MLNALLKCPRVSKPTKAVWTLKSDKDNRWNDTGAFIYKGMRGIPIECSVRIEELKLKYGKPPDDFMWGFKLSSGWWFLVSMKWWLKGFFRWLKPKEK